MAVNNMLSNVPGAVPYVSMVNDQANAVLINALNEKTKQYEQQLSAIAENEALLNQMKYRDPDRAGALLRAAKISSDLDNEIQEKYAGDYGSSGARKAVASRLAQERGVFSTLQQKYEEEQPYKQMYQQLKATGQLAKKYNPTTGKVEEVNPFTQSVVDSEGNLIPQTSIDYGDIRKRGDYIDYIGKNIVDPLNKRMRDLGLKYKQGPFAFTKTSIQGKQVGMSPEEAAATVDNNVAKRFLEENPTFAFEFGNDVETAKNYIKDIVKQKAIKQTDYQYGNLSDPLAGKKYKASLEASKSKAGLPSNFLPPSKEQGEVNPFITARQQGGETLHQLYKSSVGKDYKNPNEVLAGFSKTAAQIKQMSAKKNLTQAEAYQLSNLKTTLDKQRKDFLRYNNEVAERKTNWFDQAAQSITGSPDARYKNLTSEQRRKVRAQAPKNEEQWAKYFDDDLEGKTLTYRNERPLEPELQKYIGAGINYSGNYFRSSKGGTASKNFKDVADEAGVDELALKQAIQTRAFPVHRIDATGEYAIRIPKDLKINPSGKLDYKKTSTKKDAVTLYFTFDDATQQMSEMLRWAEQNRFETGKKSKTFQTPVGSITIEKTRQPGIFKANNQLVTKEGLERYMLNASDEYISDRYRVYLPSKKLNQPTEEYLEE